MTRPPFCPDCGDHHARTELDRDKMLDTLRECEAYFEPRAEAEYFTDSGAHPNPEMNLLREVRIAIHSLELLAAINGAGGNRPASTVPALGSVARGPRQPDFYRQVRALAELAVDSAQARTAARHDSAYEQVALNANARLEHALREMEGMLQGLWEQAQATVCKNGSALCDDEHPCAECAADRVEAAKQERELQGDAAAEADPAEESRQP